MVAWYIGLKAEGRVDSQGAADAESGGVGGTCLATD
jgi:hypothetical protein